MSPILLLAIQEAPQIIAAFKALYAAAHPGTPGPTDAEVIAAFNMAFNLSIATDDAWLAAHPA